MSLFSASGSYRKVVSFLLNGCYISYVIHNRSVYYQAVTAQMVWMAIPFYVPSMSICMYIHVIKPTVSLGFV